jgi:hypothetical protein
MDELKRIISESEIMKEDDRNWPEPDRVGRQELEIVMGDEHIAFTVSCINSDSQDRCTCRCAEQQGSGRPACLLLLDPGSEVSGIFSYIVAFQGILE